MKFNYRLKTGKDMGKDYPMKDGKYKGEPLTDDLRKVTGKNSVAKDWAKY